MPRGEVAREVAPEVRELCRRLLPDAETLGQRMAERLCAEIPEYAEGQFASFDEVVASCIANTRYILGILADERTESLAGPRATGAARADQGFPYAAVLQAFRTGGRFIWELLVEHAEPEERDVLLLAAADVWAVSDALAEQVTAAYRTALADRARRDGQRRAVLVGSLLDGEPGDGERSWQTAGLLGLSSGAEYVVVAAECRAPDSAGLPDVERLLRGKNVPSAWRLDHGHQDGVVELRPGFDVGALVDVLAAALPGRVGVSAAFTQMDRSAEARRQARSACAAGTPGTAQVVRFDEQPLAILLASNLEQTRSMVDAVLAPVLALPADDRDVMLATARTWLEAGGSTSDAAKRLHVHRNTVRYRIRRFEQVTGRDLAHHTDAAVVYVALEGARILRLA